MRFDKFSFLEILCQLKNVQRKGKKEGGGLVRMSTDQFPTEKLAIIWKTNNFPDFEKWSTKRATKNYYFEKFTKLIDKLAKNWTSKKYEKINNNSKIGNLVDSRKKIVEGKLVSRLKKKKKKYMKAQKIFFFNSKW